MNPLLTCDCCEQPINTLCDEYYIDDDYNTQCEECIEEVREECK